MPSTPPGNARTKAMSLLKSGSTAPWSNWTNAGEFPRTATPAVSTIKKGEIDYAFTDDGAEQFIHRDVIGLVQVRRTVASSPLRGTNVLAK